MTVKFFPLGLAAVVAIAACSTPSNSVQSADNASTGTPEVANVAPDVESAATETSPETLISQGSDLHNCVTWAEYRPYFADAFADNNLDTMPDMPSGFEAGCAFRVGMGMGSSISILRNGIDLSTVMATDAGLVEATDGPIPWLEGNQVNNELIETFVEQGNIATFYEACVTNAGYVSNCEGFPEEEAYVLDNDTACYEGRCLHLAGPHAIYLMSMWPWPDTIYDLPTSFSSAESVARREYQTVPLNQLGPQVPTYGQPDQIAQALFGRTVLDEGQQPTELSGSWQNEPDGLYVVYLTNDGMADDSVGGERYRLDFVSADGDLQKLVWVGKQQRCLRGNTPGWTTDLCP